MEAYDHAILDQSAQEIVDTAKRTHSEVHGPIPLPTRIERYTVLSGPNIDKKARQQFEIRTHKRLIDIVQATAKTIEALNKGDEVVTSGGLVGRVTELSDQYLTLQIATVAGQPVAVSVQRSSVATLLPKGSMKSI